MQTNPETLRQAMRSWASGVTIVTSAHNGVAHGMTVSSFTSLSLDPPRILIALSQDSRTHDLVSRSQVFGVTILAEEDEELSDRFAGRIPDDGDRLSGVETFTLQTGSPLLRGGLAHFDCRVTETFASGMNTLFIAEVLAVQSGEDNPQNPLLYFNRQYRKLQK
jgi:flavin reductase (DIM6/NTAB) family NADH-FMN oxidoreductase RutF